MLDTVLIGLLLMPLTGLHKGFMQLGGDAVSVLSLKKVCVVKVYNITSCLPVTLCKLAQVEDIACLKILYTEFKSE